MATTSSIQEAATQFASSILQNLNDAVSDMAGVDVMWFRLMPDKRSQDVIFQSYTLYGVDCNPLSFKAMYSDTGYDDAAITYNIMGINFAIPMTLDIAVKTWETATGNDGTIPQKGDIVYIPISRKLLEVVSMQPVKALGAALTSYKVNLSIYTPTRNRLLGEDLRETIDSETTNLEKKFGEDIKVNIDDIVDDDQMSIYTSTSQDKHKEVEPTITEESGVLDVRYIKQYELVIDGHIVARNYYNLSEANDIVVKYNRKDIFTNKDWRCLSCWVKQHDDKFGFTKNIKSGTMSLSVIDGKYYIETSLGTKFKIGDNIILRRGIITIPGTVTGKNKIQVNEEIIKKTSKSIPNWISLPGYVLAKDDTITLLDSDKFSVKIKGGEFISINSGENETLVQAATTMEAGKWYGIILNMGETFNLDIFSEVDGKLAKISSTSGIKNKLYNNVDVDHYYMSSCDADITNIRLYNVSNMDIDKQLTDLVSYNIRNDGNAIINDSAETYLNKEYTGRQR